MADLGTDFGGILDVDAGLRVVSGRDALIESLARRLTTPRGTLFYDFDYGLDVRNFVNAVTAPAGVISAQVVAECAKDERVEDVDAAVSFVGETLTIQLLITDGLGPFALTLLVSALTVQILRENS